MAQPSYVNARLSIMMFIQFFVWGAWFVTVGNYMTEYGMTDVIYWAYTVGPIAAIIAPFFLGMVADRFFATERVLGVLHLLGGVVMFAVPYAAGGDAPRTGLFIAILMVHTLCYMPTLGLVNTLAFHNLVNQEKQFPLVRVFGTLGWIAANVLISYVLEADKASSQFYIAGGSAILLGLYSFSLPHTPPPARGKAVSVRDVLGLDALVLFRSRSFSIFIVSSVLICIPLSAYYAYAPVFIDASGFRHQAFTMSYGQMSEVLFMLVMPLLFVRLGVKWMLVVGMLAWVARYGLFSGASADGAAWMIVIGILLHGICYDFFFVTGQIYVDKKAPLAVRGQAQGLLVLLTLGVGMLIGAQASGYFFNEHRAENATAVEEEAAALREEARRLEFVVQETGDATRRAAIEASAQEKWDKSVTIKLRAYDWQTFWLIPTIGAAVIMILFAGLFREGKAAGESARDQ